MKLKNTALFTMFIWAALTLSGPAQAAGKLSIYNWFDYMPQELLDKFSKEHDVGHIVANMGALLRAQPECRQQLLQRLRLVVDTLIHVCDAEFGCTSCNDGRISSGNQRNIDIVVDESFDRATVLNVERFQFITAFGVRYLAVRQDAVDIERDQFDDAGAARDISVGTSH